MILGPDPRHEEIGLNEDRQDRLTTDAIVRSIHAEVQARLQGETCAAEEDGRREGWPPSAKPEVNESGEAPIDVRDSYHINDLLRFHDVGFIANSYRAILGREPDQEGLQQYLDALRSGQLTKVEIIGHIRRSPEGRGKAVTVRGLWLPFALQLAFKIPVLGYPLRFLAAILRLPTTIKNIYGLDQHLHAELSRLNDQLITLSENTAQTINELYDEVSDRHRQALEEFTVFQKDAREAFNRLETAKADRNDLQPLWDLKADRNDLQPLWNQKTDRNDLQPIWEQKADRNDLQPLWDQKADRNDLQPLHDMIKADHAKRDQTRELIREISSQIHRQKLSILEQERRLRLFLREAMQRIPDVGKPMPASSLLKEQDHFLDSLYVTFEDRFRGTREDIKHRLRVYLPHLQPQGAGSEPASVLDLGCGRGEWLELIRDHGALAVGIDCNRIMVEECRQRGLDAREGDLFSHLESLPLAQVDVVTAFHVVEHLFLDDLIRMLDESLRVLKPGGVLILETPNPENLLVGACNFYYDPTHRHPLPPPVLRYLTEARGFLDISVVELHPVPEVEQDLLEESESARLLAKLIYGPRDYAVIARKS